MRSADAITIFRIILIVPILYFIATKAQPAIPIALFALSIISDGLDGYLALREASKGTVSLSEYVSYSIFNSAGQKISKLKSGIEKNVRYGPRFDVAADRITEYSFWALFTYLHVIPLFVIIIVIIRHSIVDALMGLKGTSSEMKTKLAQSVYSSGIGRSGINIVKFATFSYLILVYISGFPILPGYILVAILVLYIVVRGIAEVEESLNTKNNKISL